MSCAVQCTRRSNSVYHHHHYNLCPDTHNTQNISLTPQNTNSRKPNLPHIIQLNSPTHHQPNHNPNQTQISASKARHAPNPNSPTGPGTVHIQTRSISKPLLYLPKRKKKVVSQTTQRGG
ncbi:hypothetical protein BP00DRAFT_205899 [Aspergillus indologenus CBS 114.80]|uniref:Uncharacterized protein n=1 Tax=Aspergillus indologenus CBS 114.80 TaxID=1450541 RepID=A0A2V5I2Q8_9EURO|nr:hypothetical protein BP00DRAFT_205899 [Aspergillus indologenus CBS 114.80]